MSYSFAGTELVTSSLRLDLHRGGDMIKGMQAHWKEKGMIPVSAIKNVTRQILEGLAWIHSKNVAHRDVKGDNYLMDRKAIEEQGCRIFLSDFGTVCDCTAQAQLCVPPMHWI